MTTFDYDALAARPAAELKQIALECGIEFHPRHGQKKLAELITNYFVTDSQQRKPTDDQRPALRPKPAPVLLTRDEIEDAIAEYKQLRPAFTSVYPGDDTVVFSYKGITDSVHMTSERFVIRSKAETVARGPISRVRQLPGNDPVNNTYGDKVML